MIPVGARIRVRSIGGDAHAGKRGRVYRAIPVRDDVHYLVMLEGVENKQWRASRDLEVAS